MTHAGVQLVERRALGKLRAVLEGAPPPRTAARSCSLCAGADHTAATCPIPRRAYVTRGPRPTRAHIIKAVGRRLIARTACGLRVSRARWSRPVRISDLVAKRLTLRGALPLCAHCERQKETKPTRLGKKGDRR